MSHAQRFICIPSNPAYPSLNLAQAVGVCAYELYQHYHEQANPQEVEDTPEMASLEAIEGYYQHLESVLLKNQLSLSPHSTHQNGKISPPDKSNQTTTPRSSYA